MVGLPHVFYACNHRLGVFVFNPYSTKLQNYLFQQAPLLILPIFADLSHPLLCFALLPFPSHHQIILVVDDTEHDDRVRWLNIAALIQLLSAYLPSYPCCCLSRIFDLVINRFDNCLSPVDFRAACSYTFSAYNSLPFPRLIDHFYWVYLFVLPPTRIAS